MASAATATTTTTAIGTDEPLDTSIRLVTPERIAFQYPLAGPFRRALAYLVDVLVWAGLLVVASLGAWALAIGSPGVFRGAVAIAYFVLQWGYSGACEAVFNGQTPGKYCLGIRVVAVDGVPITAGQAILRNLLWTVEWIFPLAFMPALASMLLTRRFQRLGDLAAGTMVVVERRPRRGGIVRPEDPAIAALLPLLPPRLAAGPELSRALADYVQHRHRFGRDRREEMAGRLARPLRARYGLPAEAAGDAILCAFYHRVYLGG